MLDLRRRRMEEDPGDREEEEEARSGGRHGGEIWGRGEGGGGVVEVRELARRVGDGDFPFGLMETG
jgi:hypothetical protein